LPVVRNAGSMEFPHLDHLAPIKNPKQIAAAILKGFSSGVTGNEDSLM
jgi:hypothetical protein